MLQTSLAHHDDVLAVEVCQHFSEHLKIAAGAKEKHQGAVPSSFDVVLVRKHA